jgi:low affinity Fe/Cu permease
MAAEHFRQAAAVVASKLGSPWAFFTAVSLVVVWAITGPLFGFSQTWQLIINTGTTVITFLMVFLLQSTQNRDAKAIHLKLDELIRCSKARNSFADLEDASDAELTQFQHEFEELRKGGARVPEAVLKAHAAVRAGRTSRRPHAHRPR